jgi:hypothetical protein
VRESADGSWCCKSLFCIDQHNSPASAHEFGRTQAIVSAPKLKLRRKIPAPGANEDRSDFGPQFSSAKTPPNGGVQRILLAKRIMSEPAGGESDRHIASTITLILFI